MNPEIIVLNRQRKFPLPLPKIREIARLAYTNCLKFPSTAAPDVLPELEEVTFMLTSDRQIAKLHGEFMGIPTATDVITFLHGDVVISVETAAANAEIYGTSLLREVLLYMIHGFLHLHGHDDKDPENAATMEKIQLEILDDLGVL